MASTIIIKNGAGDSTPSSLKQGELAINVDNGKLFYGTSGSSNAVSSSFAFQHITSSGDISGSGTVSAKALTLTTNGVHKTSIDASGNIATEGIISSSGLLSGTSLDIKTAGVTKTSIDASGNIAAGGNISGSGILNINTVQLAHNGINTLNISNAGAISASSTIQGTTFTAQTNGATKATIDASGNVAAEGTISSSALLSGTSLDLTSAGVDKFTVAANGDTLTVGSLTTTGAISSSDKLKGSYLDIRNAGVEKASIDGSGNMLVVGTIKAANIGAGTDNSVVVLDSNGNFKTDEIDAGVWGGNGTVLTSEGEASAPSLTAGSAASATLSATSTLVATTDNAGFFVTLVDGASGAQALETNAALKYNPSTKILTAGAISSSATLSGRSLDIKSSGIHKALIDTTGNVAAEGYISSSGVLSGTALTLTTAGVAKASINADGNMIVNELLTGIISSNADITYTADLDGDEVGQHIFKDRTTLIATLDVEQASFVPSITSSSDISSSGVMSATALTLTTAGVHKASIDASGNVAAEGYISSSALLSGTSLTLASAGINALTISTAGALSASGGVVGSNTIRNTNSKEFQGASTQTGTDQDATGNWYHSNNEGENAADKYADDSGLTGEIVDGTSVLTTSRVMQGGKYLVPIATTASVWRGAITNKNGTDAAVCLVKASPVNNNSTNLVVTVIASASISGTGNAGMHLFDATLQNTYLDAGDIIIPLVNRYDTSGGQMHFNTTLSFYTES